MGLFSLLPIVVKCGRQFAQMLENQSELISQRHVSSQNLRVIFLCFSFIFFLGWWQPFSSMMNIARVAFPVIIQLDFEIFLLPFIFVWTKLPDECFLKKRNWNANKEIAVVVCTCSRLHTHTSPASSTTFSVFALRSENNKTPHVGCLFLRPCRHRVRVRVGRWEHCLFSFFHEYSPRP